MEGSIQHFYAIHQLTCVIPSATMKMQVYTLFAISMRTDFSDAGDFQCCQSGEQSCTLGRRKDCEKVDLSSAHVSVMDEGASSATPSVGIDSEMDPPIFEIQCPCGPESKTFPSDSDNAAFHHTILRGHNEKVSDASDLCVCNNEKFLDDAMFDENFKMEYDESSATKAFQDKGMGCLVCKGGHQDLFLNEANDSAWLSCRSSDESERKCDPQENDDQILMTDCKVNSVLHPDSGGLKLDELDDDSLFHIASLMEARSVKHSLSSVCQRFQSMFDNETYWKTRINMKWQKKYPAISPPEDFSWLDACIAGEDCQRMWSDPDTNAHHFMYACNVYGEVDTVHLMKEGKLLLSGDRNRNLNVIDLSKYNPEAGAPTMSDMNDMLVLSNSTIHKGWIWSLTSVDNHVMTGSWDTRIRVFDINSDMKNFSAHKCKSAVLSLYAEENEIVASCFDKKVYFFDRRSSDFTSFIFHKQAVMSVAGNQDYIISGSEDKTVSVYDRRGGKILTTIKLDAYSLCLSFKDNQLWFGDKTGQIHLYDATQGMFSHVGTYDVGHKDKVTGIIYTPGSIFTCSGDKTLKVLTPTRDPEEIKCFDAHNKELAKIDYNNGVLASAGGDTSIGIWLPKHWGKDEYLL